MRVVGPASEAEVVACFLRAEFRSERFGPAIEQIIRRYGLDPGVVAYPNPNNEGENRIREQILKDYRGWKSDAALFRGFPQQVEWSRVLLSASDTDQILYIDWDCWVDWTAGSRRPADALARGDIFATRSTGFGGGRAACEAIGERLRARKRIPELILVADTDRTRVVVVEGHMRLTAFTMYRDLLPNELPAFLGVSADIHQWPLF